MESSATGLRLSVLDAAPIVQGSTAREALHNSIDLARIADALGYHRYWVPEHHSMRGVASAAPAVLVARAGTHEITANTPVFDHTDRCHSYELLIEVKPSSAAGTT